MVSGVILIWQVHAYPTMHYYGISNYHFYVNINVINDFDYFWIYWLEMHCGNVVNMPF